jgi:hypothetical protein
MYSPPRHTIKVEDYKIFFTDLECEETGTLNTPIGDPN